MRISTGLRPRVERQHIAERQSLHVDWDNISPVVPLPNLKVREVWILTFQEVGYYSDGEVWEGDVMETMLSGTEPKIEKRSVKYMVTDEYPVEKSRVEAYYRRNHSIPEDAQRRVTQYRETMHHEVQLDWYEVTL